MDKRIATTVTATLGNPLLEKLLLAQDHQSDYAFAKTLGVKRSLWQAVRTGKLPIGVTLLRAIVQSYPELNTDVLDYLRGENHDDSNATK